MDESSLSRRDFLRAGTSATVMLAGGSLLAGLSGCSSSVSIPATGFRCLRQTDVDLLLPLMPTILGPAISREDDAVSALASLDQLMFASTDLVRGNLFKLYDLLQLGAARWWLTGFWAAPAKLTEAERVEAMTNWAAKRNGFAQIAFRGLTQPIFMPWYASAENAARIGYPGPPVKVIG